MVDYSSPPLFPYSLEHPSSICACVNDAFYLLAALRHHLLQQAGRFTCPKGKLTLTITDNPAV